VRVWIGNGDGTLRRGADYQTAFPTWVVATDLNGDGKPDLTLTDYLRDDVVVLLNTGTVSFSPTTPLTFPAQLLHTSSRPHTVTLKNEAASELTISSISASGPFRANGTCGKNVAAGASCDIQVSFEPEETGAAKGLITIRDSASSKPQVIQVSGAGTVIGLSPRSLSFGEQKVGFTSDP
jgi:Abnormal spindle-like microcephaly-assoc'd, ASPM-SPD-2-Hydin/FG-GAP repeat